MTTGLDVIVYLHFSTVQSIHSPTFPFANCTVGRAVNNAAKALCLEDLNDIR